MCGVSVRQIILDEPALKTKYDAFFHGILCIPPDPSLRVAKRGRIGRFRLEVLIALHPAQPDLTLLPAPNKQTLHYAIRAVILSTAGALVIVTV